MKGLSKKLMSTSLIAATTLFYMTPVFAAPAAVYGEKDGEILRFDFQNLSDAYGNEIATYTSLFQSISSDKKSIVVDGTVLDFVSFADAIGNEEVENAEQYSKLPNAVIKPIPEKVITIMPTGEKGPEVPNPDGEPVESDLSIVNIY